MIEMEPREFARNLRKGQTDAERRLWHFLRNRQLRGLKFRRQHPLCGYVVDFVCIECKLIIELDGGQHVERAEYDQTRTGELRSLGYEVVRFWDDDALLRPEVVLEEILRHVEHFQRADNPSP